MKILALFDIDGTILKLKDGRSRIIFSDIMFDVFGKNIHPAHLPNFAGMTDLQILNELSVLIGVPFRYIHRNIDVVYEKLLNVFRNFCNEEHIVILPGVIELINNLSKNKDIQLGLLTGNFRDNAYIKIATYNLARFFPFGAFGSDHRNRNKLPSIAITRANKYEGIRIFSRNNTLIIGDGPRDIECAKT
ncbi:MAG: HAD hydrolase-like protein, partial [Ignavibacteria bacterium]|nr:HAD hydrolase-like protein [Ignavibacteria bacterium]